MSQAAAEMLATIAAQQRSRGTAQAASLADIYERMADRMQEDANRWGGQRASVAREPERPSPPRLGDALPSPCDDRESAIMGALEHCDGTLSAAELGAVAKIDPRRARAIVAHLRADHQMPILSTAAEGYWIARHAAEADHTIASLESRRIEIEKAIAGIKAGCARRFGTMELDFGEVA